MLDITVNTTGLESFTQQFGRKATQAEIMLAVQIMKDTRQFVPALTGTLLQRTHLDGSTIVYPGPYARFLYYGKRMYDPVTGRGPIFIKDVGFRFPKYSKLKPTNIDLKYTKTINPRACSHWFEVSKAENLDKWKRIAGKALSNE